MLILFILSLACGALAFTCSNTITPPQIEGVQILNIVAQNLTAYGGIQGNDVCFFTVTITHPGTSDSVNNLYTFPYNNYTNRFQGQGGAGWLAGQPLTLAQANAAGFAAGTTDAGHELSVAAAQDASSWALVSTGNVNQYGLYNFARRSVHDMTLIGKALATTFYGKAPCKSYWNGCSGGGRQGLQSAQYYPEDYDGILANAPAIQWTSLLTYGEWTWSVLTNAQYFPDSCEFQALVDQAVAACDTLDGLKDNIISAPGLCNWDPKSVLGQTFTCATDGSQRQFSQKLIDVASTIWAGPKTPEGQFLWYGLIKGAPFSGLYMDKATGGPTNTPNPFPVSDSWIKGFIAKDLNFNTSTISLDSYADLFLKAHLEYDSLLGTANPDLRPFQKRGGKLITWQGLADPLVNPQGTILYYQGVEAIDPSVHDFYRLFFSPGVNHCFGGIGVQPTDPMSQLVAWVEQGKAPDTLKAASGYPVGSNLTSVINGTSVRFMDLCPWPSVNKYNGKGDPNLASSYSCATQKGWEEFPGPNGRGYNFFTAPGWYGDDNTTIFSFP